MNEQYLQETSKERLQKGFQVYLIRSLAEDLPQWSVGIEEVLESLSFLPLVGKGT